MLCIEGTLLNAPCHNPWSNHHVFATTSTHIHTHPASCHTGQVEVRVQCIFSLLLGLLALQYVMNATLPSSSYILPTQQVCVMCICSRFVVCHSCVGCCVCLLHIDTPHIMHCMHRNHPTRASSPTYAVYSSNVCPLLVLDVGELLCVQDVHCAATARGRCATGALCGGEKWCAHLCVDSVHMVSCAKTL